MPRAERGVVCCHCALAGDTFASALIVDSGGVTTQNEFIWIRTHEDAADLEAKTKAFRKEVEAAGITLGTSVAKMEVREVEMA